MDFGTVVFIIILVVAFVNRKVILKKFRTIGTDPTPAKFKSPLYRTDVSLDEKPNAPKKSETTSTQKKPEPAPSKIGNINRIAGEIEKEPDLKNLHRFPEMPSPTTLFEDFNRRLFVLLPEEKKLNSFFTWKETDVNDYPTLLTGPVETIKKEITQHLRNGYPVIYDPLGWWERASRKLEFDPRYTDPVIEAYFKIPIEKRPVVVSVKQKKKSESDKPTQPLIFYRYGFEEFKFDTRFLEKYPTDLLQTILVYFTAKDEVWESFSPARLRKYVLEKNREEEDRLQEIEDYKRSKDREKYNNRFAALWNLRETKKDEKPPEATTEEQPS